MSNRRGFTLFEATAALAIVGITSVAALSAVGAELRTAGRARRAIEAEALATSRLDFMSLLTDQELQALPDTVAKGQFAAPLSDYSWKTTSSALSDQAGVYNVAITIDWPNGAYTIRTYLYRRPPLASAP
jgi:prepilin-type N-terminal cleavage/methylation domain-containing protein